MPSDEAAMQDKAVAKERIAKRSKEENESLGHAQGFFRKSLSHNGLKNLWKTANAAQPAATQLSQMAVTMADILIKELDKKGK